MDSGAQYISRKEYAGLLVDPLRAADAARTGRRERSGVAGIAGATNRAPRVLL
jgi:hypothetical protein